MSSSAAANLHPFDLATRILETLNVSILCLDAKRQVSYANASAESLFGHSAARLRGRPFESLLSQVEHSSILDGLNRATSSFTEREAVITLAGGRAIVADYSIYPFADEPGDAELLIEIRQLERHAQFAREELNQLQQQATQQLSRGLAHEINNPLGGIRGAAQLLQRELDSPLLAEYTEVIVSEVDRLQTLISGILGPGSKSRMEKVNIFEVLEHICKIIMAAEPERIRVHRDYDPSIPELDADRDLLIQAFLNIARNVVQAIDGTGEITFRTRVDRQFTIGQVTHPLVLQVDIIDTGRGVAHELSETIFLPMITDKPDGSGLGLPITQEIISRHGGTIQLESSPAGTIFRSILPLEST